MRKSLFSTVAIAALMIASATMAQTATGTGTSNSTSNSGSTSGAQGVVGPGGSNSIIGSNANAGSNSNANTRSDSRSQSSGNANAQNINFNSPGNTTSNNSSTLSGGTNNRDQVNYGGGTSNYSRNDGDVTVRTTPTVYAPPVSGGNPCTLAVSGGVSVIGWGAAAGGTFVDEDCATRQKIAMIHNAGYAGAAKELMCNDRNTYFAFRTAGQPCAPRPAFDGTAPGPVAGVLPAPAPVPTPITSTQIAPTPVAAPRQLPRCSRTVTDNCYSG